MTFAQILGRQRQFVGAYLDRLAGVTGAPEHDLERVQAAPSSARLELKHVNFSYEPHGRLVLRDITATIRPGQKVALVGRTGSGKSTLAKLLLGLHSPGRGEILYDGIPYTSIDARTLRKRIGAVLQDSFMFN